MQNHEEAKKKSWLKETVTTSRGYHKHALPPMVDSMKKATPINTAFNVRQLLLFLFFFSFLSSPSHAFPAFLYSSFVYLRTKCLSVWSREFHPFDCLRSSLLLIEFFFLSPSFSPFSSC